MWSEGGRLVFHQRVEREVLEGCGGFGKEWVVVRVWEVMEVMFACSYEVADRK